ncbi:hypothetical protein [Roseomonas sp. HF4]|uniref:hypothetical protein n=1 Tax=Roseomonas sp. HF4 TaxID=2562313 RepID=UPI0010C10056|nr:hypothetical protein [Roseomonas sp. HF4]
MVKASLLAMLVLTVLIAMGLRWREQRMASLPRMGLVARGKHTMNRWVTAAAIAAASTMLIMGGLHYLRLYLG